MREARRLLSSGDRVLHWSGWVLLALGWALMVAHRVLWSSPVLASLGVTGSPVHAATGVLYPTFFVAGIALITRVRRLRAVSAEELLATDRRAPVLYLRSFRDDGPDPVTKALHASGWLQPSPEERLAIAMSRIGPFVAIGRPGERLPELGAARLYVGDDEWQEKVDSLLRRSQLVVLRAGTTPGFWWEVNQVLETVDLRRILFFFGPRGGQLFAEFRDRAGKLFPCALPERIGKAQFLYLEHADGRWTSRTITLRVPKLNFMGNSALEEMFLKGLGPTFARLGLPVPRHSFPLTYKFAIACAVLVGLQTAAVWRLDVAFQDARRQLAMSQLHSISSALEQYYLNAGAYPTEAQGLRVLADSGLLPDSDLLDPWGRPVGYSLSQANGAARFELVSLGADGVEGGDGSRADIKLSR